MRGQRGLWGNELAETKDTHRLNNTSQTTVHIHLNTYSLLDHAEVKTVF